MDMPSGGGRAIKFPVHFMWPSSINQADLPAVLEAQSADVHHVIHNTQSSSYTLLHIAVEAVHVVLWGVAAISRSAD